MLNLFKQQMQSLYRLNKKAPSTTKQPEPIFVILKNLGPDLAIPVRYSKKSKRISIKITHNGAELILPNHNLTLGRAFLLEKESWVRRKLASRNIEAVICPTTLPIFGKIYKLNYIDALRSKVEIKDDIITVYTPIEKGQIILEKFLKKYLLAEIEQLARDWSAEHSIYFTKIRIMNNQSKWGSCSSKARLSFNWRLIFAPKEIL